MGDYTDTIGVPAPEVRSDFMFPASAKHDRLPRLGQVSLIITGIGDQRGNVSAFSQNVLIHRLKERFPELDIIFLTSTKGVIAPMAPPSPAEEAGVFETMLLGFSHLPITLVVANGPYLRLQDPDRRRVNLPVEGNWRADTPRSTAMLIDREGLIVDVVDIRYQKEKLMEMIQCVFQQNGN